MVSPTDIMQRSTSGTSLKAQSTPTNKASTSDAVATNMAPNGSVHAPTASMAIGMSAHSSGYYGHLDESQQKALQDMKDDLRDRGFQIASLTDEAEGTRTNGVSELELL